MSPSTPQAPLRHTSTDYAHPYRPSPIRLANGIARRLGARPERGFDAARLVNEAQHETRLDDFGPEWDPEPLERLCASIREEARLTPVGAAITRGRIKGVLTRRLRAEAYLAAHPDALRAEDARGPIVIAGLQRTGTTMLHRLLAADPQLRSLASYEALDPVPPSGLLARATGLDLRRANAKLAERGLAYLAPDFFAIHPVEADAPEEEVMLLDYAFLSTVPEATLRVPSFSRWLEGQDQGPAYRYLKRLLKVLAHGKSGARWVLKTPHHLEWLDTLLDTFPDARVVHTHRDPLSTTASFCSMIAHGRGVFSDEVDPHEVGREWGDKVVRLITRAMETRERRPEAFIDVRYEDLLSDPIAEVKRIYAHAGQPFDSAAELAIRTTRAKNAQHRYGKHIYRLSSFGLDADELNERFRPYRDRFGITPPS